MHFTDGYSYLLYQSIALTVTLTFPRPIHFTLAFPRPITGMARGGVVLVRGVRRDNAVRGDRNG